MTDLSPTFSELAALVLFVIAIVHTFATGLFARLAHRDTVHAGLWHLLAEVEVVFGFWAMVLVALLFAVTGSTKALDYVQSRDFTEPLFVFAIMVVAASRPVLQAARMLVAAVAGLLPLRPAIATYFVSLSLVPLLGSLVTEPAAMTLAALLLRDAAMSRGVSERFKYATLGVLFVNISIGGVLTPYAAPPVLMVAGKWGLTVPHMLGTFGWRAAIAVFVNAVALTWLMRGELARLAPVNGPADDGPRPHPAVIVAHLAMLAAIVTFAHYPAMFLTVFMLFLGFTEAYRRHQNPLILRESLLVAFFLAGLVTLGGLQQWWLQPLLTALSPTVLFYGAIGLTAITDNAALTYLGSLVEGVGDAFQYALLAGAVTGGGLTVIANAPNPAGLSILKRDFRDESVGPLAMFAAAIAPTLVAILAFQLGR